MGISIGYRYLDEHGWAHWHLIIDGRRHPRSSGYVYLLLREYHAAYVYSRELTDALAKFSVGELVAKAPAWTFRAFVRWHAIWADYRWEKEIPSRRPQRASIQISFDSDHWNYPWSVTEFGNAFIRAAKKLAPYAHCDFEDELPVNGLVLALPMPAASERVGPLLSAARQLLHRIYDEARRELVIATRESSLVTFFDFPEKHRTACKQYLVYFAEFLKSLGIEAKTELVDDLPEVLFAVTPNDGKTALEKVRAALAVYLRLPERQPDHESLTHQSPEIKNLARNVQSLRDHVLESVASPLIDSATNAGFGGTVASDAESFLGGRVKLKKWDWGPFEINFPTLMRDLKARFPMLKKLE